MTTDIWKIERDADYRDWLAKIEEKHPRVPMDAVMSKRAPGSSFVGRVVVMADGGNDTLRLGVRLNTGDEFWKDMEGSFDELLARAVGDGTTVRNGKWLPAAEIFPADVELHGPAVRMESHSSHVGGGTQVILSDGATVEIDFD